MIRRYPCQVVILFILGILAAKGAVLQKDSDTSGYGTIVFVLANSFALVLAGVWIHRKSMWRKKLRQAAVLCLAFVSGFVRMGLTTMETERQLAGIEDEQKVNVQGRIIKKQQRDVQEESGKIQWTIWLSEGYLELSQEIHSCHNMIVYLYLDGVKPVVGNTILVSGNTKLFQTARNEGNFDECAYYQNQGYLLKIYADEGSYQVVDTHMDAVKEGMYQARQKISWVFEHTMPQQEAGTLSAMLLGEKSQLSDTTKELYTKSGIAHILAISGLHISILGMAVFRLLRKRGCSYFVSAAGSMILLFLFGIMAGMGISTVRALIMFGIYLGAACVGRAYDSVNGLAAAAGWILWDNPRVLFLAGFQFSFAAVAGVLVGQQICRVCKPRLRVTETVLVSLGIQMMTLPLTAWYYFEIPVYSLLLNLFVLPFMELVLVSGLVGGSIGICAAALETAGISGIRVVLVTVLEGISTAGSKTLLGICGFLLGYFSKAGELFLKLPGAVWMVGRPKVWQLGGYYVLLAVCIYLSAKIQQVHTHGKENEKNAWLCSTICCLGSLFLLLVRLPKAAEVDFLDVGQGDGIYIRTDDGMDVFIDGGSSDVKQVGTYRILPFLKSKGISQIDYWFVSHLDQDHISGLMEITESGYPIAQVVLAEGMPRDEAHDRLAALLFAHGISIQYLDSKDVLKGKTSRFHCLAPEAKEDGVDEGDRNAKSMVLFYEDSGFSAFFSGDISAKEEQALAARGDLDNMQTVLYKAAHHGSKYSNSRELLNQLRPQFSVVSCAEENDYGHPGEEAVQNMEAYSDSVYYTMYSGQIQIRWDSDSLRLKEYKVGGDIHQASFGRLFQARVHGKRSQQTDFSEIRTYFLLIQEPFSHLMHVRAKECQSTFLNCSTIPEPFFENQGFLHTEQTGVCNLPNRRTDGY